MGKTKKKGVVKTMKEGEINLATWSGARGVFLNKIK
jgi:hypothetical protein